MRERRVDRAGSSVRSPRICLWACALALVLSTAPAVAEDDALSTDRPGDAEGVVLVPRGTWQLELGWTFGRDDEDGVSSSVHQVPSTLLRVGLAERFELRLGWAGLIDAEVSSGGSSARDDGAGDAFVGAKIHLAEARGRRPAMALVVNTSVPIGDDAFTSDRFDPNLRLAFDHGLSESVSLGYNVGLGFASGAADDGERHTLSRGLWSLVASFSPGDRWGAFAEVFGDVAGSASGDAASSFDGGVTYLVNPDVQLDVNGGVGLTDAAGDAFIGLGISIRLAD